MEVEAAYGFLPSGMHHLPYGHPHHNPEGDDDLWEYFPCPFCYIEVEVPVLCNHLQEEHCFDMKNAVCPICADNLGKDKVAHFRFQHSHLVKRRKSSKPSSWPATTTSSASEKEAYEVNSYLEVPPHCMGDRQAPDSGPDPLLLQFICSIAPTDTNSGDASVVSDDQRPDQCMTNETSKQKLEERLQRVEFLKEILMSTIF